MQWKKSIVKVPDDVSVNSLTTAIMLDQTEDISKMDLLINGFINQYVDDDDDDDDDDFLKMYIPNDVVSVIVKFCAKEAIHLLKSSNKKLSDSHHFVVTADAVFCVFYIFVFVACKIQTSFIVYN